MTRWFFVACLLAACVDKHELGTPPPPVDAPAPTPPAFRTRWALTLGSNLNEAAESVAVDAAGDVVVSGTFEGTVDFGNGVVTAGYWGGWLSKRRGSDGTALWTRTIAPGAMQLGDITAVTVAADGSIIAVGNVMGDVDVAGTLVHGGAFPIAPTSFVASFDGDGNPRWVTPIAGVMQHVAAAPDGHLIVGGVDEADPLLPAILTMLDGTGAVQWTVRSASTFIGALGVSSVLLTPEADVIVGGTLRGTSLLAGAPLPASGGLWIARLSPTGAVQWTTGVAGIDCLQLTLTSTGSVVAGSQTGGRLPRLDAFDPNGMPEWSVTAVAGTASPSALAVLADGRIVSAGGSAAVDFGDGVHAGQAFVATFDPNGRFEVLQTYAGMGPSGDGAILTQLASGPAGMLAVSGDETEAMDMGTGPLRYAGNYDALIAVFDPL